MWTSPSPDNISGRLIHPMSPPAPVTITDCRWVEMCMLSRPIQAAHRIGNEVEYVLQGKLAATAVNAPMVPAEVLVELQVSLHNSPAPHPVNGQSGLTAHCVNFATDLPVPDGIGH